MKGFRVDADKCRTITYNRRKRLLRVLRDGYSAPVYVELVNVIYKEHYLLVTLDATHKVVSAHSGRIPESTSFMGHTCDGPNYADELIPRWYAKLHWKNPALEDEKDWGLDPSYQPANG